ncbi:hypothetical protein KI387_044474, partial [Taxus chinensis]
MNGTKEQIQAAQQMISEVVNKLNPGYGQQGLNAGLWAAGVSSSSSNGFHQPIMGISSSILGIPSKHRVAMITITMHRMVGQMETMGMGRFKVEVMDKKALVILNKVMVDGNDTSQQGTVNAQ